MITPPEITPALMDRLCAEAAAAPRRRCHHNLHPTLADPVQRLAVAMQPGSYVRPHRHAEGRFELFLALRGRFALLRFDDRGTVLDRHELFAGSGLVEVPGGTWHSVVALAPDSVFFEVKPGPYVATDDKDFAAWAPREGEPGAGLLAAWYAQAEAGAQAPDLT